MKAKHLFALSVLCLFAGAFTACAKGPFKKKPPDARVFYELLGTVCTINLYEDGTEEIYARISERLNEIHRVFSVNLATSDVAQINLNAGIEPVRVRDEVLYLIDMARYFAEKTDGAFDPTIGALSVLWNIGPDNDNPRVPSPGEIDSARSLVDYTKILMDKTEKTVFLPTAGMIIDLGGIAKGYAADEIIKIIRENGVSRALVDLGGNIYVYGEKPASKTARAGEKWRIGIKDPVNPEGDAAAVLEIDENSVVTSGAYERFFERDGKRYHHILDTKTGYPAESGVLSATIVSPSSLAADALSTSVFVMGREKGIALLEAGFPEIGVTAQGLVIDSTREVTATRGLRDSVVIKLDKYHLN